MSGIWKKYVKDDTLEWLLGEDNPSVRYFTLTKLLDRGEKDLEVALCRKSIMERGVVPRILDKQHEGGHWEKPEDFYVRTKFRGTVWQFIILAELGADKGENRIKNTCEFVLDYSQDRQSGGFSYRGTKENGGYHSGVIPCLTGNMVWSLIRFGYLDDPRVQRGIEWITNYQRFDDRAKQAPAGWPYDKWLNCWGKHTCHLGVVKSLKALAEIPVRKRTAAVKNTIKRGAEYLLLHHLYKRSHNLSKVAKPKWLKLGFPWMWDTDVLEMLSILTRLDYRDSRMQEGIDLVLSKQDNRGRWLLEQTYNGRFQVNIERKDFPSKWVTFHALQTLKKFHE